VAGIAGQAFIGISHNIFVDIIHAGFIVLVTLQTRKLSEAARQMAVRAACIGMSSGIYRKLMIENGLTP
jgi:hypothetical protein